MYQIGKTHSINVHKILNTKKWHLYKEMSPTARKRATEKNVNIILFLLKSSKQHNLYNEKKVLKITVISTSLNCDYKTE